MGQALVGTFLQSGAEGEVVALQSPGNAQLDGLGLALSEKKCELNVWDTKE